MRKFDLLTDDELLNTEGGVEPISIALGIGSLLVASVKLGYDFGKDLANRDRRRAGK